MCLNNIKAKIGNPYNYKKGRSNASVKDIIVAKQVLKRTIDIFLINSYFKEQQMIPTESYFKEKLKRISGGNLGLLLIILLLSVSIFSKDTPIKVRSGAKKNDKIVLKASESDSIPKFIDSIIGDRPKLTGGIDQDVIVEETFLPWIDKEDSLKSISQLNKRIDALINRYDNRRTRIGVAVYSLDRGEFIYERKADDLYTPASTTKLFTVMSAFYLKGDNGTIDTELYTNGYLDMDTVLMGDLFIRGQGNVFLEGEHIKTLAKRVSDMGIRKIDGNIYIDEGFFDGKTDRFKYSGDADVVQKLPPIRPLILNNANLKLEIEAGAVIGEPVDYSFKPSSTVFIAENKATVKGSRTRGDKLMPEEINKDNAKGTIRSEYIYNSGDQVFGDKSPHENLGQTIDIAVRSRKTYKKSGVTVTQVIAQDTIQKYKISGAMSTNRSTVFQYPIKDMQRVIAGTLEYWLENDGIEITGQIGEKSVNEYKSNRVTRIAKHGFPLLEMAMPVNKKSNNFTAEQMFKFNGAHRDSLNNYEGAREVFLEMLDSLDIECEGCRLNDGSGLSRRGLVKPRAMVELLVASTKPPFTDKLRQTLAIAGVDGTIRKRMRKTKAKENLIAKTGTLRNVSALAGFVTTMDGETLAFSILSNGPSPHKYKKMEDRIGDLLASFFYTGPDGKRESSRKTVK